MLWDALGCLGRSGRSQALGDALGRSGMLWDAQGRIGMLGVAMGHYGMLWDAQGRSGTLGGASETLWDALELISYSQPFQTSPVQYITLA